VKLKEALSLKMENDSGEADVALQKAVALFIVLLSRLVTLAKLLLLNQSVAFSPLQVSGYNTGHAGSHVAAERN